MVIVIIDVYGGLCMRDYWYDLYNGYKSQVLYEIIEIKFLFVWLNITLID